MQSAVSGCVRGAFSCKCSLLLVVKIGQIMLRLEGSRPFAAFENSAMDHKPRKAPKDLI